jgi:hypothetical protein
MILTVHVIASSVLSSVLPPGISHGASLLSHYKLDSYKHWEAYQFFKGKISQHIFVIFDIAASFYVYYLILSYFNYSAFSLSLFSSSLMGIFPDLAKYFNLHKYHSFFERLQKFHEKMHSEWRDKIKDEINSKIGKYKNQYCGLEERCSLWKNRAEDFFSKNLPKGLPILQFSLAGMLIFLLL